MDSENFTEVVFQSSCIELHKLLVFMTLSLVFIKKKSSHNNSLYKQHGQYKTHNHIIDTSDTQGILYSLIFFRDTIVKISGNLKSKQEVNQHKNTHWAIEHGVTLL